MSLATRYAAITADRRAELAEQADRTPVTEGDLASLILLRWENMVAEAQARYPKPSR